MSQPNQEHPPATPPPTEQHAGAPAGPPASGRRAGILLHPTSLPGPFGVGDLGPAADRFLAYLAAAGQSVWQVLPLGPPAWGGSPYGCLSAFAGNPLLLSPERLVEDGLLDPENIAAPGFGEGKVVFGRAADYKQKLLHQAFANFRQGRQGRGAFTAQDLDAFREGVEQQIWLPDWSLFAALKAKHKGRPWWEWKKELVRRDSAELAKARATLAEAIDYQVFLQFLFDRQWRRLRREAASHGIALMGDLPIYVAHDSADVWAHPELFDLDPETLAPRHVAGVPPDYFSEDGQLWGNPLYDWQKMEEQGFGWWIERLRANLRQADLVRLDHFRGFAGFWQVPAGNATAKGGRWVNAPGQALFAALAQALGDAYGGELPVLAEDLGEITPDVDQLRHDFNLPGMRVLQFGFGAEASGHTPHRIEKRAVVYTGTHDNDTTVGWYRSLGLEERERFHTYTGSSPREVHWTLIRVAYATAAELALVPIQDVLGLSSSARMNTPGVGEGNWAFRLKEGDLQKESAERLRRLAEVFERLPRKQPAP